MARVGEEIHVRRDVHVAHGALEGGGSAVALGTLIDHGNVDQPDIAVFFMENIGLQNIAHVLVFYEIDAAFRIRLAGGNDEKVGVFALALGEDEGVVLVIPTADVAAVFFFAVALFG